MKILVVGSGGREHAIALKLKENLKVEQIFAAPGNGGMAAFCTPVNIKATDVEGMVAFAKENGVEAVVLESHRNWVDKDPVKSAQVSARWLHEHL